MAGIATGVLLGIGATVAMDLWAILLNKTAGIALPNWANVGRWFWHLTKGTVFHADIGDAESHPNEARLGWLMHYAVGIVYGVVFVILAGRSWLADPSFLPAWIFSLVTVAAGWFLLQPGMGLGWAASKTDDPRMVRMLNLAAHTAFAVGLWGTARLLA